jgi:hypothetical protein
MENNHGTEHPAAAQFPVVGSPEDPVLKKLSNGNYKPTPGKMEKNRLQWDQQDMQKMLQLNSDRSCYYNHTTFPYKANLMESISILEEIEPSRQEIPEIQDVLSCHKIRFDVSGLKENVCSFLAGIMLIFGLETTYNMILSPTTKAILQGEPLSNMVNRFSGVPYHALHIVATHFSNYHHLIHIQKSTPSSTGCYLKVYMDDDGNRHHEFGVHDPSDTDKTGMIDINVKH